MKHYSHRQQRLARLLLMVFVPMLLCASLHNHHYVESDEAACAECVHHHSYAHAHFTSYAEHIADCVLCQFLSFTFFVAATVAVTMLAGEMLTNNSPRPAKVTRRPARHRVPRAPPLM